VEKVQQISPRADSIYQGKQAPLASFKEQRKGLENISGRQIEKLLPERI